MRKIDLLGPGLDGDGNVVEPMTRTIAATDDPQVIFTTPGPLVRGWYRFETAIRSDVEVDPQVYFDFGEGYSEVLSVRPARVGETDTYVSTVKLPARALGVRIDPISTPGEFVLKGFSAERLSAFKVVCDLASYGLEVLRANPRGFFQRLPAYLQALATPRFLRMSDARSLALRNSPVSYKRWIANHDFDAGRHSELIAAAVAQLEDAPLISVLMPVYNTPETLLREAIDSVRNQIYHNWQLCVADDCSTAPHVRRVLEEMAAEDERIKVAFRQTNGHISQATNSAFELAEGEWIALLDHDDLLRPHALAEVALEIGRHPDAELIYSDEDKIDGKGMRYEPYFKPDFSRELFRSQNYLNHLTVHRAENIRAVGGWRVGFEGSQDYDLSLRVCERIDRKRIRHIAKILYHWRAAGGSTASSGAEKGYAFPAGLRALEEHVERMQLPARVEAAPDTPFYRLRFAVPQPAPLVSLIIPTRDRADLLANCVGSILKKTSYTPYEIVIIDNGSVEKATLDYFAKIEARDNVRVLRYDKPFNYSAINNFAVSQARGAIVGLINNDIEVISQGWLTEMVSWAVQHDVGCVGAKLYYENDTIQHAGVILGIGGVAGHSHKYFPRDHPGYFSRLKVVQNLSAVTGACLLVRKSVYLEAGGLNEKDLTVAFNDVDFCLRLREAGYLNVWTPYAELYHLESLSRGAEDRPEKVERFGREIRYMQEKWSLCQDPYYSIHLSQTHEDFSLNNARIEINRR